MTGRSSGPISPVRRASSAGHVARMLSAYARSSVVGRASSGSATAGNTGAWKLSERSTPKARLVHVSTRRGRSLGSAVAGSAIRRIANLEQPTLHEPVAERGEVTLDDGDGLLELRGQQRHGVTDTADAV